MLIDFFKVEKLSFPKLKILLPKVYLLELLLVGETSFPKLIDVFYNHYSFLPQVRILSKKKCISQVLLLKVTVVMFSYKI